MTDALRSTAYHESGHCCAATSLGNPPIRVSIEPNGDDAGTTTCLVAFDADERDTYLMAGAAAECRLGLFDAKRIVNQSRQDISRLSRPNDYAAILERAHALLDHDWERVEAIAAALLAKKTLDTLELMEFWND